ncbi:YaiI/YqxD family protein [Tannockella kyphosi]|uniref:YaiI/YqxD family protein n=1 Tax=Tannockella kyphosi TaxID=2899121 RepID=UPI0020115586|nr:DUF188 domain-containing protein [Tannockella kyphosi]
MKVIIDGDACPDRKEIVQVARKQEVPVIIYCDYNHEIEDEYSEVVGIHPGNDAVDLAIVKECQKGDLVITQDYGLSALVLAKGSDVINPRGFEVTNDNIDMYLMQRHIGQKERKKGYSTHYSKRTKKDTDLLIKLIEMKLGR